MISKILMCRCYKEEFKTEGHTYNKKLIHFHCKCKEKHFYYILLRKNHPFGADFGGSATDERKCNYKSGLFHEVCGFCFSNLLTFKCSKICVEEVFDNFIERAV